MTETEFIKAFVPAYLGQWAAQIKTHARVDRQEHPDFRKTIVTESLEDARRMWDAAVEADTTFFLPTEPIT